MNYCEKCMSPLERGQSCGSCGKQGPAPVRHLKPGTILNQKYLIGRAIGQGGFGITYIGRDLVLDTRVAIKEYFPNTEVSRDHNVSNAVVPNAELVAEEYAKALERFLMEARILAKFSNEPGVVGVRDFFRDNGTAYIVMEYLDGITLKEYLRLKGPVPANVLLKLMEPVLQVLHKIHQRGLIHRDISPDNLMLMKDGRLKLLDFGAAREFVDEKSLSIVLKQGYAPVEQYWNGDRQGAWTDVYAVCATIYKCLTGVTPVAAVQRAVQDELKPPSQLGIAISPQQEQALMRGLAVKDADRYRSMEELVAGFAAAAPAVVPAAVPAVERTVTPQAPRKPSYASDAVEQDRPKSKTPLIIALVAVLITAAALGVWLLLGRSSDKPEDPPEPAQTQTQQPKEEKPEPEPEKDPVTEPVEVEILSTTVEENGVDRVKISFTVGEQEPKEWIASYHTGEEKPQTMTFTGTEVTITDLEPDSRYEIELTPSEEAVLKEPVILVARTQPAVRIVEDSVQLELQGREAVITWKTEGAQPEPWNITITGDKGYEDERTVTDNELKLEDLTYGETYTVEFRCENMVDAVTTEFTLDTIYIDEMTAEILDDGSVEVTWQCEGGEDQTWYLVCTPSDAPTQSWTQESTEMSAVLTSLRPGKTYTIELCNKDGEALDGKSSVSVDVPNSDVFTDYGFEKGQLTFYLCPEGRRWSEDDLQEQKTNFSYDERIAFACRSTAEIEKSSETVTVTILIKDATSNTVSYSNTETKWNSLWDDGVYLGELEETPTAPGTYTMELYINTKRVDLTGNSFTVES